MVKSVGFSTVDRRRPKRIASVIRVRQYALQSSEDSIELGFLDLLEVSKLRLDCLVCIDGGSVVTVGDPILPLRDQAGKMHADWRVFPVGEGNIVEATGIIEGPMVGIVETHQGRPVLSSRNLGQLMVLSQWPLGANERPCEF